MKALLDTHAFLWWISDDCRLSDRAREFIGDGRNELFFSAASGWEISIKAGLGRLEVPGDLQRFIADQLSRNAIKVLPIYLSHTLHTRVLPDHHRDPFDRILAAQSLVDRAPLATADDTILTHLPTAVWD